MELRQGLQRPWLLPRSPGTRVLLCSRPVAAACLALRDLQLLVQNRPRCSHASPHIGHQATRVPGPHEHLGCGSHEDSCSTAHAGALAWLGSHWLGEGLAWAVCSCAG